MSLIKFQPRPKVPPIGFFQPISVDPKDMMTDVEYLLGILKKLNEMIAQINSNTKFIEDYDGRIEVVEAEIKALRNEMSAFETQIDSEITNRFNDIKVELRSMIASTLAQANAYTDATAALLHEEIQQISIGNITVYDPTTGLMSDLQIVLNNLYGASRGEAITAGEYDALELTASTYDGYDLTAQSYDLYGKTLLTTP